MAETICVHIVDDEEIVRRSLGYAMASAGFASRVYASAEQFMAASAAASPGCVVTDVRLPGMDGLELVMRLKAGDAPHPVVVISGEADIAMAVDAMKAGAADFLQKPFRTASLLEAVNGAIDREGRQQRQAQEAAGQRRKLALLSPRQREVLAGIMAGKLNKTIGHELGISVRTVEDYRAEIMAKTQARNLSELIRTAVLAGL
jgi:two-component system response regulator FixJ